MKEIKVLYHVENPELDFIGGYGNSNAIDLYTAEDVTIDSGEFALINLGISIKLPENYGAKITPRSGTFKKYGLIQTNSIGIIDNTYSSKKDIYKMPVFKIITKYDLVKGILDSQLLLNDINRKADYKIKYKTAFDTIMENLEINRITIPKGTRLCQMEVIPLMDNINIVKGNIDEFSDVERGGFGGTGL